jgi:hypothetical protein
LHQLARIVGMRAPLPAFELPAVCILMPVNHSLPTFDPITFNLA